MDALTIIILIIALIFCVVKVWSLGDDLFGITRRTENKKADQLYSKFQDDLNYVLNNNLDGVIAAYRRLVTSDAFGEKRYDKFSKELKKFIFKKSTVWQSLDSLNYEVPFEDIWQSAVIKQIELVIQSQDEEMSYDPKMDPYDYEIFCANEFKRSGWDAQETKASSDQGVDVVANRDGLKLVAQCKKFAKPVGNSAVQEIVAGMKYYDAALGVVIAPNGYTPSAVKLASANDIQLIHHTEIKNLVSKNFL
jgi:restriction system protein